MSEEQVSAEVEPVASTEDDSWRAQLSDELREHSTLEPIQSVENLAKAYVNASSMIGRDKVALPGQYASDEDWNQVYDKLGRPETGDQYELEAGEGADENLMGWFKETAHSVGMNNAQAQKFISAYNDMVEQQAEQVGPDLELLRDEVSAELRKEYGNAFDDRLGVAKSVVEEFSGGDMMEIELADGRALGDHPDFIRAMVNVGTFIQDKVSEDQFLGERSENSLTPDEAQSQLRDIEAPNGPLWDRTHPQHDYFVAERGRLYEQIYGVDAVAG